jgi:hypothetical protein
MYQIPDEAIARTIRCPHDFSCLKTGRCGTQPMCAVSGADGRDVLFLDEESARACPNRLCFGARQVCVCPAHYACYEQYGV